MNQVPETEVTRPAGDSWPQQRMALIGIVLLTSIALLVRAIGLNDGLWYDEIRTLVESVRSPLWRIVTVFPGDNQHTFFSVLAHLSVSAFGEHPWSLRLPAMLLGAATIPALYVYAREFTGRTEAFLACVLLTFSYHHVWFSQSARGYAVLAFLTLVGSWLLLRGLESRRIRYFVLYALVATLAIYTHVTMVFLVASHALLCVLPLGIPSFNRDGWLAWRLPMMSFSLAATLALLLYLPVLLDVKQQVVEQASPMRSATPAWAVGELLRGLRVGFGSVAAAAAGLALLVAGALSYLRQNKFLFGMFMLPAVLTVAATIALERPVRPRFVFFLAGFGVLIIVRGALVLGGWIQRAVLREAPIKGKVSTLGMTAVLILALLSALSLQGLYKHPKQDFVGAMQFVDKHAGRGELIMTAGPATYPYQAYFHKPWPAIKERGQLLEALANGTGVWIVYTLKSYIDVDLLQLLDKECDVSSVFAGTVGAGEVTVCHIKAE